MKNAQPAKDTHDDQDEQTLRSNLILFADLQKIGPYNESSEVLARHCDRIAKEMEIHLARINRRIDPVLYEKFNSVLKKARSLKNKARSASKKGQSNISLALLYGYGSLFGLLGETLTP